MHTGKSKTKQRQMPFQMHISPIFGEVISRNGVKPYPQKPERTYGDATSKNKIGTPSIPWNN